MPKSLKKRLATNSRPPRAYTGTGKTRDEEHHESKRDNDSPAPNSRSESRPATTRVTMKWVPRSATRGGAVKASLSASLAKLAGEVDAMRELQEEKYASPEPDAAPSQGVHDTSNRPPPQHSSYDSPPCEFRELEEKAVAKVAVEPSWDDGGDRPMGALGPCWSLAASLPFTVYVRRSPLSRLLSAPVSLAAWALRLPFRLWEWFRPPPMPVYGDTYDGLQARVLALNGPRKSTVPFPFLLRASGILRHLENLSSSLTPVATVYPRVRVRVEAGTTDVRPSDRVAVKLLRRPNHYFVAQFHHLLRASVTDVIFHEEVTNMMLERMQTLPHDKRDAIAHTATALSSSHQGDSGVWARAASGSHLIAKLRCRNRDIDREDADSTLEPNFEFQPHRPPVRNALFWLVGATVSVRLVLALGLGPIRWRKCEPLTEVSTLAVSCKSALGPALLASGRLVLTLAISLLRLLERSIASAVLFLQLITPC